MPLYNSKLNKDRLSFCTIFGLLLVKRLVRFCETFLNTGSHLRVIMNHTGYPVSITYRHVDLYWSSDMFALVRCFSIRTHLRVIIHHKVAMTATSTTRKRNVAVVLETFIFSSASSTITCVTRCRIPKSAVQVQPNTHIPI